MDSDDDKVIGNSNSEGNKNTDGLNPNSNLNPNDNNNFSINETEGLSEKDRFISQGLGINPSNPLYQLQQNTDKKPLSTSGDGTGSGLSNAGKYLLAGDVIAKTDELKTATQSLQVNELEKIYFDRKLKPLIDSIWELSTAAQNFAGMSNLYQANNYGKKRDVKQALDLSLKILDECEDLFELVKLRLRFFENNIDPYE